MKRGLTSYTLLGPPGSGKGTYGLMLAEALQCPLRSTSDILRDFLSSSSNMSPKNELYHQMNTGQLLDDSLVHRIVCQDLIRFTDQSVVLIDGFPRTIRQLELMQTYWPTSSHMAIHVHTPDDVCITKIMGRRRCSICHGNFNIAHVDNNGYFMPPTLPNASAAPCWNRCGGRYQSFLVTRPDDSDPQIVQSRLQSYHEQTVPVIRWYRQHEQLLTFTPYRGKLDFDRLKEMVYQWLSKE